MAARRVMLRHPWARRVLEERGTAGVAIIGYVERSWRILLDGGFSLDLAHHSLHVLGSRIFGFSQDLFDDSRPDRALTRGGRDARPGDGRQVPTGHRARRGRSATRASWARCDDDVEFAFGLDLILDGLERRIVKAT